MDHLEWRAAEINASPTFDRDLFALRGEARRERRQSERFSELRLDDLAAHVDRQRLRARDAREFRWSDARVDRDSFDPAPNEPASAADRYVKRCQALAGKYLGATAAATVIHAAAAATAPVRIDAAGTVGHPAPAGGIASSAAAALSGAQWRAASTHRAALMRVSPADRSDFFYTVCLTAR